MQTERINEMNKQQTKPKKKPPIEVPLASSVQERDNLGGDFEIWGMGYLAPGCKWVLPKRGGRKYK